MPMQDWIQAHSWHQCLYLQRQGNQPPFAISFCSNCCFTITDINECFGKDKSDDCLPGLYCKNIDGGYVCECPSDLFTGDGRKSGTGCIGERPADTHVSAQSPFPFSLPRKHFDRPLLHLLLSLITAPPSPFACFPDRSVGRVDRCKRMRRYKGQEMRGWNLH